MVIHSHYPPMPTDVSDRVREIAQYRDTDESAVIQQAVESGIETLWRDVVIAKYLDGDLTREEAVNELGADVIHRVDRAKDAIDEDIEWGLEELRA